MPRVLTLIAALCTLLVVSSHAEGRELTRQERAYARALGKRLKLKPKQVKGLTSKSGAKGVKVSFLGLDVSRLHFRSPVAAKRFATKRSREKGRQRIALREQEILVLRGARLSNAAFAKSAVAAAWAASPSSPSASKAEPRKDGILAPLSGKSAGKTSKKSAPQASGAKPSPRLAERDDDLEKDFEKGFEKDLKVNLKVDPTKFGRAPRLALAPSTARAGKRIKRPGGIELEGAWATLGRGRVVFSFSGQTKTSDTYEVLLLDFESPTPPLVGTLTGRRLSLRAADGKGAVVEFLWTPSKVGGRFVRVGAPRGLLPARTSAFWRG